MMKSLFQFLLVFFINLHCFSQNHEIDSLKAIIKNNNKINLITKDKINTILSLAWAFQRASAIDSLNKYALETLKISQTVSYQEGIAQSNLLLGIYQKFKGQYYLGLELLFKSLSIFEKTNDLKNQAEALYQIANCYYLLNQYTISEKYYQQALVIFKKINHKTRIALCINNLGYLYSTIGKNDLAIKQYNRSIKLFIELNNLSGQATTYENLGIVYSQKQIYDSSEVYLFKARKLFVALNQTYLLGHTENEIAKLFLKTQKINLATKHSLDALKLVESKNYSRLIFEASENLYNIYKQKQPILALKYHEIMLKNKDLMNEVEINKRLNGIKFEYDNQKQKELNILQQKEIDTQKKSLYYLLAGLITFIVLAIYVYYNNIILKRKNTLIENQKNEILNTKSALELLNENLESKVTERTQELKEANQILITKNREIQEALLKGQTIERKRMASELHDNLGGQISAIRWSLMAFDKNKLNSQETKLYEQILNMTSSTYEELRHISHNLLPQEFEKNGLIGALEKLIYNLNFTKKIIFNLEIDNYSPIDRKIELELYSIILELTNNIIKHSQATHAHIELIKTSKALLVDISDNGIGIDVEKASTGMGMNNIANRIREIGGVFEINTLNESSHFYLKIPI